VAAVFTLLPAAEARAVITMEPVLGFQISHKKIKKAEINKGQPPFHPFKKREI
jgi:hypothetical protein